MSISLYEVNININTRRASASFIKSIEQTDTFGKKLPQMLFGITDLIKCNFIFHKALSIIFYNILCLSGFFFQKRQFNSGYVRLY